MGMLSSCVAPLIGIGRPTALQIDPFMTQPHRIIESRYVNKSGKRRFVRSLFDRGARHYDRIGSVGFFGSGHFYRKTALKRAGLKEGMKMLDVACGTGAVTKPAAEIAGEGGLVWGIDPSHGMLAVASKNVDAQFQSGYAEELPFDNASFDFLSMGYALRHVDDLGAAFAEYYRVLRPGGRLLLLEITRPTNGLMRFLAWGYFGVILPRLSFLITGSGDAREMMSYYWETIEACVPPHTILRALEEAGFRNVDRRADLGIFSEYRAEKD